MDNHELAAAIRRGAAMTPWCRNGQYYDHGATCAIGAAAVGLGAVTAIEINNLASKISEEVSIQRFNCKYKILLINANDSGLMTREQIADALDALDTTKPKDAQTFDAFLKATLVPMEIEAVQS